MKTFRITVVKYGTIEVDANELDEATERVSKLPDAAITWEQREFADCEEIPSTNKPRR